MLMTFSKPVYMERILSGVKIHTIRTDTHKRWRVGMTAHMWMHSPRNVSKNPFPFAEADVYDVCDITISKARGMVEIIPPPKIAYAPSLDVSAVAINDGFNNAEQFFEWFGEFKGRIIFWENLRPCKNTPGQ